MRLQSWADMDRHEWAAAYLSNRRLHPYWRNGEVLPDHLVSEVGMQPSAYKDGLARAEC
jgi:hypothetical protein